MAHTITYHPTLGIIEVVIQGKLYVDEAEEAMTEMAVLARKHGCFFVLSDFSEATFAMDTFQIYQLPRTLERIMHAHGLEATEIKRAYVAPVHPDHRFYETVTLNMGQVIRLFEEIEPAMKWLMGIY